MTGALDHSKIEGVVWPAASVTAQLAVDGFSMGRACWLLVCAMPGLYEAHVGLASVLG